MPNLESIPFNTTMYPVAVAVAVAMPAWALQAPCIPTSSPALTTSRIFVSR